MANVWIKGVIIFANVRRVLVVNVVNQETHVFRIHVIMDNAWTKAQHICANVRRVLVVAIVSKEISVIQTLVVVMDSAFQWDLLIIVIVNHHFRVKTVSSKMFVLQIHVRMVDIVNLWVARTYASVLPDIPEEIVNNKIFVMLETHVYVVRVKMIPQIHLDLNVNLIIFNLKLLKLI